MGKSGDGRLSALPPHPQLPSIRNVKGRRPFAPQPCLASLTNRRPEPTTLHDGPVAALRQDGIPWHRTLASPLRAKQRDTTARAQALIDSENAGRLSHSPSLVLPEATKRLPEAIEMLKSKRTYPAAECGVAMIGACGSRTDATGKRGAV